MNARLASIPFKPRTVTNCLDLAAKYCGRRLSVMLTLWAAVAVPTCALVYSLLYFYTFDLRLAMLAIYIATTFLGACLTAAVTPGVFEQVAGATDGLKEPIDSSPTASSGYLTMAAIVLGGAWLALVSGVVPPLAGFRDELSLLAAVLLGIVLFAQAVLLLWQMSGGQLRLFRPIAAACGMRLGIGFAPIILLAFVLWWTILLAIVFAILPGIPLAARFGFVAERACLLQFHRRMHHRGTDRLIKAELGELFLRLVGISLFFGIVWLVLFLTFDVLCSLVFQVDILIGRMGDVDFFTEQFWDFLGTDPKLLTAATATALLAYPITRIAWFLCYIDLRVRRDCWDLELGLTREAARLRETA